MAEIVEHEKDCRRYLGKDYKEVHNFLDQYAKHFPVGFFVDYHRSFLHNSYGLDIIKSRWGSQAYIAGLIHLFRDYMEGPINHLPLHIVLKRVLKCIMYFNKISVFDPGLRPHIIRGWEGRSLCSIAFEEMEEELK